MKPRSASIAAGSAYFAIVFGFGSLLGTIRMLWGAAALGETLFILIELPVMLLASFATASWLVGRLAIASTSQAAIMGGLAFALLMAAELVLVGFLSPGAPIEIAQEWLAGIAAPPGVYGFLGQVAFGLIPLAIVRLSRS
ncbi:MAG: hypothetical protein QNJ15_02155 [Erythrobacter sp.]|nr:hypothetical protein [Erythrobacter sp.]